MHNNIYTVNGYDSREHYLRCLAEDYGVDYRTVRMLASLLGQNEDFDGLIVSLEDLED